MIAYEYPSLNKSSSRSIPITTTSQNLFMLEQAKMRVQNEYLNDHSIMSNRKDRYNSHLNDVIDQERVNKNVDVASNRQKTVPTRQENKSIDADKNIALYNIRDNTSLNNQNIIGNVLPERLRAMNDNKITTPNAWMKDYAYVKNVESEYGIPERFIREREEKESFGGPTNNRISDYGYGLDMTTPNYNGYLSMLMPSSTNIPQPRDKDEYSTVYDQPNAAMFPDERLQVNMQSQQRQIKDEGSKVIDAINLKNSDYIKERNQRQIEMENMMNHRGQMKLPMVKTLDYIDMLDEQNNGIHSTYYEVDERFVEDQQKTNSRNSGGNKHATNKGTDYKLGNITRQQNINNNVEFEDRITNDGNKPIYKYDYQKQAFIPCVRGDKNIRQNNTDYKQDVYNRVIDERRTEQGIYKDDYKKNYYIRNKEKFNDRGIEDINKTNQSINQNPVSKYPIIPIHHGEGYINKEPFSKDNQILVIRHGKIENVYTDPNSDTRAPVLITVDNNNKPVRVCATANNKALYVIQKRDPTYIDIQDGTFYKDDYIVLRLPMEEVNKDLRRRLEQQKKNKTGAFSLTNKRNGTMVVDLEYNDLVTLAETLNENLDKCKRVKADSMKSFLKDKKFDQEIVFGIKDDRIFTTPWVLDIIHKYERANTNERNITNKRGDSLDDKIINGIKKDETFANSVSVRDSNIYERARQKDKERIDKEIINNYGDIKPRNFNTWNKEGTLGKVNDYHNETNIRNQQLSNHYFNFEDIDY